MKSMQHESSRGLGNPIESDETSVLFTSRNGNGISAKRSVQAGQSDHRSMVVVKLLLFFFAFFPIAGYADLYSIASGPKNGYYHWIGESLASSVAAKKGHLLLNIESSGSIENLSLLQEELADFAILQHDLANEVHFEGNQYKHFSVLAPLFPEVAQIAIFGTHLKRSKNLSLTDLIDLFKTDQIEAIYTAHKSDTGYEFIHTLLKLYGVDTSNIKYQAIENATSISCRTLCVSSHVSNVPYIQQFIAQSKHRHLSISENEYVALSRKLTGFEWFKVSSDGQADFYSLGVWAILIASTTIDFTHTEIQDQLTNSIFDLQNKKQLDQPTFNFFYKSSNGDFILIDEFNTRDASYPALKQLPRIYSPQAIESTWHLPVAGVVTLCLIIFLIIRMVPKENSIIMWYRYQHFCYAFVFLIASILLFSAIIYFFERQLSTDIGRSTVFSSLSLVEVVKWVCIFGSTGFNNNIFPVSDPGQIFATISPYIGYAAAFSAIIAEFLLQRKTEKRKNGEVTLDLQDHIVICGVGDRCSDFIEHLLRSVSEQGAAQPIIVVITDRIEETLASSAYLERLHQTKKLEFVKGYVRNPSVLEAAKIHRARLVYLLSKDGTIDCDEKTLLRALSISKYCRAKSGDVDSIYMVAEISNPEFVDPLKNADVNDIVNTSAMCESILLQSVFNPGVGQVVESLFRFDENDEFYTLPSASSSKLQDKTFDELAVDLRKSFVALIGIRVQFQDTTEKLIVDDALISARLKELGLSRATITNPATAEELAYKTRYPDSLIVLAKNPKVLEQL